MKKILAFAFLLVTLICSAQGPAGEVVFRNVNVIPMTEEKVIKNQDVLVNNGEIVTIGNNLFAGMHPQAVVPRGVWQGARLAPGGRYALLGCTVAPGFDYADYESGSRAVLAAAYPQFAEEIATLTAGDA